MAAVPKRVSERLISGIKRFQPILASARTRDLGEADTVTIVTDMLAEVFGYEKYSEITSEYAIRGTYCDLAIKLEGVLQTLIESAGWRETVSLTLGKVQEIRGTQITLASVTPQRMTEGKVEPADYRFSFEGGL